MSELERAGLAVWAMTLGIMVAEMTEVEFPWEALATLIAGTAAVIGAVSIGKKQTRISEGQNKLLAQSLRKDLFEHRFKVFKAAEAYLNDALAGKDLVSSASGLEFMRQRARARFLFDPETNANLLKLSNDCHEYYSYSSVNRMKVREGMEVTDAERRAVIGMEKALYDVASNLPDIFGPETTVSDRAFIKRNGKSQVDWGDYGNF